MDAETALNVQFQNASDTQEDSLGYYGDGALRTLTDEQIAMFRHSEIEELLRERRLRREEEEYQERDAETERQDAPPSPASDASSLEGDLVALAKPVRPPPKHSPPKRQPSRSSRSDSSRSNGGASKRRRQEVPYSQRHKRRWEHHIEATDPVEGARTHRRIAREMDDQEIERVDVDYGEDTAPPPAKKRPDQLGLAHGRRVVSYDDF